MRYVVMGAYAVGPTVLVILVLKRLLIGPQSPTVRHQCARTAQYGAH